MRKVNYKIGNVTTTDYELAKDWKENTKIPYQMILEDIPEPLHEIHTGKYKQKTV